VLRFPPLRPPKAQEHGPKGAVGAFELDPDRRVLRKDGLRIRVPGQSLEILAALVATPGETLGRERIQQLLWPHGTVVGFDQSINAAVKRLRLALGDTARNPRFVERVPGRGYRFIAPVEALEPARRGRCRRRPARPSSTTGCSRRPAAAGWARSGRRRIPGSTASSP
jgi:DNA-binding winged helix-turn-helix (wHTH) protein